MQELAALYRQSSELDPSDAYRTRGRMDSTSGRKISYALAFRIVSITSAERLVSLRGQTQSFYISGQRWMIASVPEIGGLPRSGICEGNYVQKPDLSKPG